MFWDMSYGGDFVGPNRTKLREGQMAQRAHKKYSLFEHTFKRPTIPSRGRLSIHNLK